MRNLVLLVLLGLCAVAPAGTVFTEDFEGYDEGNVRDVAATVWNANGSSFAKIQSADLNKYMVVGYTGGDRGAVATLPTTITGSEVAVFTSRIYMTNRTYTYETYFGLSNDAAAMNAINTAAFDVSLGLRQTGADQTLFVYNGGTKQDIGTVSADTWNVVQVIANMTSGTFDVYVGPTEQELSLVAFAMQFRYGIQEDLTMVGAFGKNYPDPCFRIDDINISTFPANYNANTPTPANGEEVDLGTTPISSVSWLAATDPNISGTPTYNVYFYGMPTDDVTSDTLPNFEGVTPVATTALSTAVTTDFEMTYFWKVEFEEASQLPFLWTFTTLQDNLIPTVDFTADIKSSLDTMPAEVDTAVVVDDDTVTATWELVGYPGMLTKDATQMYDRNNVANVPADPNFLVDWIGTDTRSGKEHPLVITISGVPAGTYDFVSYHHDSLDQYGAFNTTITDANGAQQLDEVSISKGVADTMDVVTKVEATVVSDGSDLSVTFTQVPSTTTQLAFFVCNGFTLTSQATSEVFGLDFTLKDSGKDKEGFNVYYAEQEVIESFTAQDFTGFGSTITVAPVWPDVYADTLVATLTSTSEDLTAPMAELTTNLAGTYNAKLTVVDGKAQTASDTVAIYVYDDKCELAQNLDAWTGFSEFDADSDCVVDLYDYAMFAKSWMDDLNIDSQVNVD